MRGSDFGLLHISFHSFHFNRTNTSFWDSGQYYYLIFASFSFLTNIWKLWQSYVFIKLPIRIELTFDPPLGDVHWPLLKNFKHPNRNHPKCHCISLEFRIISMKFEFRKKFGQFWTNSGKFEQIRANSNRFRQIRTNSEKCLSENELKEKCVRIQANPPISNKSKPSKFVPFGFLQNNFENRPQNTSQNPNFNRPKQIRRFVRC